MHQNSLLPTGIVVDDATQVRTDADRPQPTRHSAGAVSYTHLDVYKRQVHEYVEDPEILSNALQAGHEYTATLISTANRMLDELKERGWE